MVKENQESEYHLLSEEVRKKIKDQLDESIAIPNDTLEAIKNLAEWNSQGIALILRAFLEL